MDLAQSILILISKERGGNADDQKYEEVQTWLDGAGREILRDVSIGRKIIFAWISCCLCQRILQRVLEIKGIFLEMGISETDVN
jgi:hypothetical protein